MSKLDKTGLKDHLAPTRANAAGLFGSRGFSVSMDPFIQIGLPGTLCNVEMCIRDRTVTIPGHDNDNAPHYLIAQVRDAIEATSGTWED